MRLTLDREDLKPEYKDINCSQTKIEHFKMDVKVAIIAVGKAQFREYDGSNYNAIYSPVGNGQSTVEGLICPICKHVISDADYWAGECCVKCALEKEANTR